MDTPGRAVANQRESINAQKNGPVKAVQHCCTGFIATMAASPDLGVNVYWLSQWLIYHPLPGPFVARDPWFIFVMPQISPFFSGVCFHAVWTLELREYRASMNDYRAVARPGNGMFWRAD